MTGGGVGEAVGCGEGDGEGAAVGVGVGEGAAVVVGVGEGAVVVVGVGEGAAVVVGVGEGAALGVVEGGNGTEGRNVTGEGEADGEFGLSPEVRLLPAGSCEVEADLVKLYPPVFPQAERARIMEETTSSEQIENLKFKQISP